MVTIEDIQKLYVAEFLTAFQTAVNRMSVDGIRISHVTSKAMELAKYMGEVLDESWKESGECPSSRWASIPLLR